MPKMSMALPLPPALRSLNKKKKRKEEDKEDQSDEAEAEALDPVAAPTTMQHFDWSVFCTSSSSSSSPPRPTKRLSTGSNEDDELLRGIAPDCFAPVVTSTSREGGDAADDDELCNALETWKPFVDKVGNYMMAEHLPFEYFDVWVPTTPPRTSRTKSNRSKEGDGSSSSSSSEDEEEDDEEEQEDTSSSHSSNTDTDTNPSEAAELRLCHVGHGTNDAAELSCIFTMYQMNQFGNCSEKYSFPPGIGLPGRVFRSKQPTWDDALQRAPFRDFPRTQLAKRFGLQQGLAIPLSREGEGNLHGRNVIIAMYATHLVPRNDTLVKQAVAALLQDINPTLPQTPPSSFLAILPDATEVEMARMLVRYYNSGQTDCFPLVCLLWRAPCNRTPTQNNNLQQLKGIFLNLKKEQQQQQQQQQQDEITTTPMDDDDDNNDDVLQQQQEQQQKEPEQEEQEEEKTATCIDDDVYPQEAPSSNSQLQEEPDIMEQEQIVEQDNQDDSDYDQDEDDKTLVEELLSSLAEEEEEQQQKQKQEEQEQDNNNNMPSDDDVAATIVMEWDRLLNAQD